jgi:hypothetical protein
MPLHHRCRAQRRRAICLTAGGGVIPAPAVRAVNLASLADRFAIVVEKGDDLA